MSRLKYIWNHHRPLIVAAAVTDLAIVLLILGCVWGAP